MSEPTPGAPCIPERHRPDSALALRISLSPSRGEASFTSGARIRVTLCWRGEGMGGGVRGEPGSSILTSVPGIFFFH